MKVPISWLKEFVNIDIDIKTLADKLTMTGTKVEKIEHLGQDITNVIVGKVVSIIQHSNADKLVITKIDIGKEEHLQIVTGAKNLKEGDIVPVALAGATLAGGLVIKKGKLRGETSDGMLCSIEELGYSNTDYPEAPQDGIYVFQDDYELGLDVKPLLGLIDDVLEFEITSNRPDCQSVMGIAREVAAALQLELRHKPSNTLKEEGQGNISELISIENKSPELCPRYIARVVKNIKITHSPQWLRRRLLNSGIKPINNIVDITNYVMLEYGQPMHAFDISAIEGGIVVRNAYKNEKITTLDATVHSLYENTLVIADHKKAIGIAGIMGGEYSKITDNTMTILFESANFSGSDIRQSAKKLGLRTESSGRYEKGLDPQLSEQAITRACELVEELGCGQVIKGYVESYPVKRESRKLNYSPERINALLGTNISAKDMEGYLNSLGIFAAHNIAQIPTWRYDIEHLEDLAEEIARLYGYNNIATVVAKSSIVGKKSKNQRYEELIIQKVISLGYSQALTYAFESPKVFDKLLINEDSALRQAVKILNPMGEDTSIMRTTSANAMLSSLATNYAKRNPSVALFEIAKVYLPYQVPLTQLPLEKEMLTLAFYGKGGVFDLKGELELILEHFGIINDGEFYTNAELPFLHPGRAGKFSLNDEAIDILQFGQVHPQVTTNYNIDTEAFMAIIDLQELYAHASLQKQYRSLPKYPAITRDLGFVLNDDISAKKAEKTINSMGGKYLESLQLFDVYKGTNLPNNQKSFAFKLKFRASDRTLTDEEINKVMTKIIKAMEDELQAKLRAYS